MAENVKFYKLTGSSRGDVSVSRLTYEEYKAGPDSANAIMFAKVHNDNTIGGIDYFIWANGVEYNVPDGSLFQKLISDVSTEGLYEEGTIRRWIQDAITDANLTAEKVYSVIDASNKTYDTSDGVRLQIIKSAEGIDVSVRKGENDESNLLIGVDLDKIYLPRGVQRTEAIGVCASTDTVVTEGVGMSVKELLEYWLLKEKYKGKITNAAFSTAAWSIKANGGKATPDDMKSYVYLDGTQMTSTTSLVEVGTAIRVALIDVSTTPILNGSVNSKSGTPASITEMFKYSDTSVGQLINESSSTGITPKADFSYLTNFDDATATLTLTSSSNNIISSSSNTGKITSNVTIYETSGTLQPGSLTLTLGYTNTVSASRSIDSSVIGTKVEVYPVSNKDNVSTGKLVANGIVPSDSNAIANNNIIKSNTSVTIDAVYPIYTNASIGAASGLTESFKWHGEWSMEPKEKLPLRKVKDDSGKLYFYVGNNSGEDANKKLGIYIPNLLLMSIASSPIKTAAEKPDGTYNSFNDISGVLFEGPIDTSVNNVGYKLFKLSGIGSTCFELSLSKN